MVLLYTRDLIIMNMDTESCYKKNSITDFIYRIRKHPDFSKAFVHLKHIPAVEASYGKPLNINCELAAILKRNGIERLFSHQSEAINRIRNNENIIIATPTASGKSLIYNLAVLERLISGENSKALYIFPLKALEQDQYKTLTAYLKNIKSRKITADIYDGDTTQYKRQKIRSKMPDILFTNPDMLHMGILPVHERFRELFTNLQYVVIDEVHTYRGIFGSHMNQIIRRLKRVCKRYGANPRFILLSATINNPHAFGRLLIGDSVSVIDTGGSPRADQYFMFLNPDTSSNFSAARLFGYCMQAGFRTIVFTQSRQVTELIHIWTSRLSPDLRRKVSSYRAGFMPEERREIEKRLATGDLLGVVSTSALELGIDIGNLDICILVGYPGTIINTWQRGGRVGRSGRESMIIMVAKPDALDQYFVKHPDHLFERSYEAAILDPDNEYVVRSHLPCAADEFLIKEEDKLYWPTNLKENLEHLESKGMLIRSSDDPPSWRSEKDHPHREVNIRSVGKGYTIFDRGTGAAIGTIDAMRAFKECHPGAIYLHMSKQYVVETLDIEHRDIIVKESDLNYFTRVHTDKDTEIIEVKRSKPEGQFIVKEGTIKVTERVTEYEKRVLPGQELIGVFPLDLPEQTFETHGFWIEIDEVIDQLIQKMNLQLMGGIHAIEHGAIGIFPLFALCDRNDIGGICYPLHPQTEKTTIFIYDGHPGGVGLARRGFEIIAELLRKTHDHIQSCECEEGCPSCIHSPKCGSGNNPLDKGSALAILEYLLGDIPVESFFSAEKITDDEKPSTEKTIKHKKPDHRILFFDLETQKLAQEVGGWNNCHLMRISVAVIYDSIQKKFYTFTEDKIDQLIMRFKEADLIVGFNTKGFDYKVLGAYTNINLYDLPSFDILEELYKQLGFRLSLDNLAKETIKKGKSADGLKAVEWFKKGDIDSIKKYCIQDVAATKDLFYYGLEKGHLFYRDKKDNRKIKVDVDWDMNKIGIGHKV
jgi:DEAD/DEAH box helicase domain-containing protein